ncbi:hypothetical protein WJ969_09080 [Achromobacter xylosoxidans]
MGALPGIEQRASGRSKAEMRAAPTAALIVERRIGHDAMRRQQRQRLFHGVVMPHRHFGRQMAGGLVQRDHVAGRAQAFAVLERALFQAGQAEAQGVQGLAWHAIAARLQQIAAGQQARLQRRPVGRRQMGVAGKDELMMFGHPGQAS